MSIVERASEVNERAVRAAQVNEQTDKRVAQYFRPDSWLFRTTVCGLSNSSHSCFLRHFTDVIVG